MDAALSFCLGWTGGLLSSLPIAGPTSVVVLTRALQGHISSTRIVVAGAAVGEAIYAALAFFGFSAYLAQYPSILVLSRTLAASICIVLGIVFLLKLPRISSVKKDDDRPGGDVEGQAISRLDEKSFLAKEATKMFCYGCGLTGLNPSLVLTWTGITSAVFGSGLLKQETGSWLFFGLGVCAGIQTWFNLLLTFIQTHRKNIKPETIQTVVSLFGLVLVCVGSMMMFRQVIELVPVRDPVPTTEP